MDAKQLINKCEQWSKEDRNNHRAAVILSDAKTQQYYIHYADDGRDMAHLVTALMSEAKREKREAELNRLAYAADAINHALNK